MAWSKTRFCSELHAALHFCVILLKPKPTDGFVLAKNEIEQGITKVLSSNTKIIAVLRSVVIFRLYFKVTIKPTKSAGLRSIPQ